MPVTFAQVLEDADEAIRALRELHADACARGLVDTPRRIETELNGWGPQGGAIPRYRWVRSTLRGETRQGTQVDPDAALPSGHISYGERVVIREGLLHLRSIPGLAEAMESGQDTLRQPLDPQLLAPIARGLPVDSGIRIVSAWSCVPAASLSGMIRSIRQYVLDMRS